MATAIKTFNDLLLHELSDLYSAEAQIVEALPDMVTAASNPRLVKALKEHLQATKEQVKRLDQVFKILGEKPSGEVCTGMKGLLSEGGKLLRKAGKMDPAVLDAALIGAAQRVEHYEIAGYGCARTYCKLLGLGDCEQLLQQSLDEEGEADKLLTQLAIGGINTQAMAAGGQA
ncbi:ferritin-like domain-containing protein [bacterium]|nr:ferritin-like domain-containing protein [bacterium]